MMKHVVFGNNLVKNCYMSLKRNEEKLGVELQWNRGDDIKFSKVFITLENVSIENETNWLQMAKFHADWIKEFFDVIVPYVKEVAE